MESLKSLLNKFNKTSLVWANKFSKAWSLGWLTQLCIGALIYGVFGLLALILPNSKTSFTDITSWFAIMWVPAVIWSIFILYRLAKYNSEKLYGNRSIWHNFIEYPSYILQLILPFGLPVFIALILAFRVGNTFTEDEINNSCQSFEDAQIFFTLNYGSGNYTSRRDAYNKTSLGHTYIQSLDIYFDYIGHRDKFYRDYRGGRRNYEYDSREIITIEDSIKTRLGNYDQRRPLLYPKNYTNHLPHVWKTSLNYEKRNNSYNSADSLKDLIFYHHHADYELIQNYYDQLLESIKVVEGDNYTKITSADLLKIYKDRIYGFKKDQFRRYISIPQNIMDFDYSCGLLINQIRYCNKAKKKAFYFFRNDYIWSNLLFIACLSLVIVAFKHTSIREFIISGIVLVLLPFVNAIIMAFLRVDEDLIFFLLWLQFIVLYILAEYHSRSPLRNKKGAVFQMFRLLTLPFIFLFILITLDEVFHFWRWDYFDKYLSLNEHGREVYNQEYQNLKRGSYFNCLLAGFIAFILIFYPFWIKKQWINFISKPKIS